MSVIQVILIVFSVLALAGVILRFRRGGLPAIQLVLWSLVWIAVIAVVADPEAASSLARLLGVGRGADVVVYISIAAVFYLLFRMFAKIEDVERRLTKLTRELALKGLEEEEHERPRS